MPIEITNFVCDGEDPNAVPPSPDDFGEVWGNPTFPPALLTDKRNAELMRSAPATQMNALIAMKHACADGLELDELGPGDAIAYASLVDPLSVLALIDMVENRITDEEIAALHQIINDMGKYIHSAAPGADADALLLKARQLVGLTS